MAKIQNSKPMPPVDLGHVQRRRLHCVLNIAIWNLFDI